VNIFLGHRYHFIIISIHT